MHSSKSCASKQRLCLNTYSTHHGSTASSRVSLMIYQKQWFSWFLTSDRTTPVSIRMKRRFHNQVTVHTIDANYKCPKVEELVKEELSPNHTHDSSAVSSFVHQAIGRLKEKRGLSIGHLLQFTNGCSAQLKSKQPFKNIAVAHELTTGEVLRRREKATNNVKPNINDWCTVDLTTGEVLRRREQATNNVKPNINDWCTVDLTTGEVLRRWEKATNNVKPNINDW